MLARTRCSRPDRLHASHGPSEASPVSSEYALQSAMVYVGRRQLGRHRVLLADR